jgi:hypothetical protein
MKPKKARVPNTISNVEGLGLEVDAARDSADSEQPGVLGTGSRRVEALAGGGPDAVRADQESASSSLPSANRARTPSGD